MLKAVNLSLSSACGADCLYCPEDRGVNSLRRFMSLETAERITAEIVSGPFRREHAIEKIELGENGDAFLNRECIPIMRHIKKHLPGIKTEVYTNFQNLTAERAETILGERLIDSFHVNIDGASQETYRAVKGLDLERTLRNMGDFLSIRSGSGSSAPLTVHVLTLHTYISEIVRNFGVLPLKLKDPGLADVPDDFDSVRERLETMLDMKKDSIVKSGAFAWSERKSVNPSGIDYGKYVCPLLERVEQEAFISPDGRWYACCYDSGFELVLGDLLSGTLQEIYSGPERKKLLRQLKEKKFAEIGGPCSTVNCCQMLGKPESWPKKGGISALPGRLRMLFGR